MKLSNTQYCVAITAFLLCIAYSLVLHNDTVAGRNLDSVGIRVVTQYSIASILMLVIWAGSANVKLKISNASCLLSVGIVARLVLLFVEPYTSNDVARYLFDGRIALAGLDPYSVAHDAAALTDLRQQWLPPSEHAKYTTLYPPLALGLFSAAASFGPDVALWAWKAFTTSGSIALLLLGYRVLQRQDKQQHLPLLALSPLLILEPGEGLHLDIFTALSIVTAVYFWQSKRFVLVGLFIAAGGLLKVLPMVLLLPLFIALNHWRDRADLIATTIGVWLSGYAVSFYLGFKPIGSVAVFFEKWRSGSALFLWLEPHVSNTSMIVIALSLLLVGFTALAVYLWRAKLSNHVQKRSFDSYTFMGMQLAMALPLAISPVIFPWYLLPVLALLALRPNVPIIVWSLSIPLLYEVLDQFACCDKWSPADWPVHVIGLSLIVSAVISILLTQLPALHTFNRRLKAFLG